MRKLNSSINAILGDSRKEAGINSRPTGAAEPDLRTVEKSRIKRPAHSEMTNMLTSPYKMPENEVGIRFVFGMVMSLALRNIR